MLRFKACPQFCFFHFCGLFPSWVHFLGPEACPPFPPPQQKYGPWVPHPFFFPPPLRFLPQKNNFWGSLLCFFIFLPPSLFFPTAPEKASGWVVPFAQHELIRFSPSAVPFAPAGLRVKTKGALTSLFFFPPPPSFRQKRSFFSSPRTNRSVKRLGPEIFVVPSPFFFHQFPEFISSFLSPFQLRDCPFFVGVCWASFPPLKNSFHGWSNFFL